MPDTTRTSETPATAAGAGLVLANKRARGAWTPTTPGNVLLAGKPAQNVLWKPRAKTVRTCRMLVVAGGGEGAGRLARNC